MTIPDAAAPDEVLDSFTDVLLVLNGGGSLGAFHCGVYHVLAERLRETGRRLVAVAGASIGAINAAVIGRNISTADGGTAALDALWDELSMRPLPFFPIPDVYWHRWNGLLTGLIAGNASLYLPNYAGWTPGAAPIRFRMPFHHTQPMEQTLARHAGEYPKGRADRPLLLVRAMNVETGAPTMFHSARQAITPRHLRASAAIPLLFDPIELDGQWFWDGDMCSRSVMIDALAAIANEHLLEPGKPLLVVVVNTLPRAGRLPRSEMEASYRLESLVFGGRGDTDERFIAEENGHLRLVDQLHSQATTLPEASPLRDMIARERVRLAEAGKRPYALLRIDREELEHDHVSRTFDYSPDRITRLIEQGEQAAAYALRRISRQELQPAAA